ncbi:MAG TPA: glycosyltransferase, partial [Planctomycetaceae bacterium]|nr:glycosyltransferase [Planctomycetaceae bacterium]
MHVLFVHQNFPAQFRYLAPRLVQNYGWQCSFVTERKEDQLPGVQKIVYEAKGGATPKNHECTRNFENAVWQAAGVYDAMKLRPDIEPDLIVSHTGFGSSLFLPFLYDAPIINFMEYFYRPVGQDFGYRPDLPIDELSLLRLKTKNAMIMLDVENCDRGWTPTYYQRDFFPPEFRSKIDVIFDGIDTSIYHRRANERRQVARDKFIPSDVRIVTYVARGFERMRGFDIFMQTAKRIYEQFPNVVFVVVGSDRIHYGGELAYVKEASYREHCMNSGEFDLSKFLFTGFVMEDSLAEILSISDLHIYLTEPFIASWSMVDAMSCGAVVLASDQRCVREYITPGENGLLADFFDVEGLARQAVEVLRDPAKFRPLSEAAQRTVAENYSVEVALPRLKSFFEQVAAKKREPSTRAADLVRDGSLKRV